MSRVYSAEDAWVRVWESLQPDATDGSEKSLQLTSDWAFIQDISLDFTDQVSETPRFGALGDKVVAVGSKGLLRIGLWQDGTAFTLAKSSSIKYYIELYFIDEITRDEVTLQLRSCTPVKRGLTTGELNKIAREWQIGRIT